MNNFNSYGASQTYHQPYQATQYFPQPQGSIYMIGNSNDVANVPVGAGLSAAICLSEGIMYLKTIQNGSPMLLGYRLCSLEDVNNANGVGAKAVDNEDFGKKVTTVLEDYGKRIERIENHLTEKSKYGGNSECQF